MTTNPLKIALLVVGTVLTASVGSVMASDGPAAEDIFALKEDALGLELHLRELERRQRRDAGQRRVDVYVVLDNPHFRVDRIQASVRGGTPVETRLDALGARSLARGGAVHVLSAELPSGRHELTARFEGDFLVDHGRSAEARRGQVQYTLNVGDSDLMVAVPIRRQDRRAPAPSGERPADVRIDAARYLIAHSRFYEALLLLAEAGHGIGGTVADDNDGSWLLAEALIGFSLRHRAQEVLDQLDPQARPEHWAQLQLTKARIDYRAGAFDESLASLDAVRDTLVTETQYREWRQLRSQILMDRSDYPAVIAMLDGADDLSLPAQLNLGIALSRHGDLERGERVLDRLIRSSKDTELARDTRDRARLFLANRLFEQQRPHAARNVLAGAGEGDLYRSLARVARGWGEYEPADRAEVHPDVFERSIARALREWEPLLDGPLVDLNVQEALVAAAFVMERAGREDEATEMYQEAVSRLEASHAGMEQSRRAIRSGQMVETILRADSDLEGGIAWELRNLPDVEELDWLLSFMARHEFQEPFKLMRDLRLIQQRMHERAGRIAEQLDPAARQRYYDLRDSLRTPGRRWQMERFSNGPMVQMLPRVEALRVRAFELANEQAEYMEAITLAELNRMDDATRERLVEARFALARIFEQMD